MNPKYEHQLHAVFRDPPKSKLHWREIELLLRHLGAAVEPLSGARVRVKLNGMEGILHRPPDGGPFERDDVQYLRGFLTRAGVTPPAAEDAT